MKLKECLDISNYDKSTLSRRQRFIKTVVFFIVANTLAMAIYTFAYMVADELNIQIYNIHENSSNFLIRNKFYLILLNASIYAPIREELGFRLCLTSNKRISTAGVFFAILLFAYLLLLCTNLGNINKLRYLLPIAIIGCYIFYKWIFDKLLALYRLQKEKFYRYVFLFDGICFGLLHLMNFRGDLYSFIFAIFMTFPAIVFGLLLCYVRINFGFTKGLLLHMIWNAATFII